MICLHLYYKEKGNLQKKQRKELSRKRKNKTRDRIETFIRIINQEAPQSPLSV